MIAGDDSPAYASYALSRLVPRLLFWLEWLDLRILRCRWRWVCMALRRPVLLAAQAELEAISFEEER